MTAIIVVIFRFSDLRISYSGGLRDDCTGIHTFIFLKRKGRDVCQAPIQVLNKSQKMVVALCVEHFHRSLLSRASNLCSPTALRSDVPANVKIDSFGPGATSVATHHEDVIVICKRYCCDRELCQAYVNKTAFQTMSCFLLQPGEVTLDMGST